MTSWGGGAQAGRHGAIGPETQGIHPTNEQQVGECTPNASIGSRTPPLLTTTMSQTPYYIGIDVGTGSVRAGLVKPDGTLVASRTEETITWRDPEDHRIFEQSTNNIWAGMCKCIKACLQEANVAPSDVKGIGFDATCSLAVSDMNGDPVVVTKGAQLGQNGDRNIILWADHRAEKEADLINSTGSAVLDYVGGTMSVRPFAPRPAPRAGLTA